MAPQRFASMRYRSRQAVPFRDDTSLVAFRYEHTVQAEPPILIIPNIPPRNPARASRPTSTVTTTPIIIPPPPIPPEEQHPAFRNSRAIRPITEEWKRDSGLAPTSSTVTIREECVEDFVYQKLDESENPPSASSGYSQSFTTSNCQFRAETPEASSEVALGRWEDPRPAPPSPALARDGSKKLSKAFSFRSNTSNRLRKRSISDDAVAPAQSRGSKSPKSAKPKMPDPEIKESESGPASPDIDFTLNTNIPTERLIEDDFLTSLTFSKRGSLMFGGKRAFSLASSSMDKSNDKAGGAAHVGEATHNATATPSVPSIRVMSLDVERESQKVRSLYESGEGINWEDGGQVASLGERLEPAVEVPSDEEEKVASPSSDDHPRLIPPTSPMPRSGSFSQQRDSPIRKEFELAGGIEDWEDVDGADVDRYGFISIRRPQSRASTPDSKSSQPTPRRRNVLVKRPDSAAYASSPLNPGRAPSRKVSARSLYTQASDVSNVSRRSTRSSIRAAANLLPHNKDRRWMDEAGEMLMLAPGLADIAENEQVEKISGALKKKEWERSEKWRKMAKVVKKGKDGEGMEFEFDVKNPKLIDRTWKGIPDRWRAAAWYSFLATSAKRGGSKATDEHIIADFHRLQNVSSSDDVQIDLDVPRTINRHIMFRKRYRGGQRLLFRVLHALSLYFPDTGYVQGMASLAATLLCYYDEEKCFVMLVRMWQLRGLKRLYQPGFSGLMTALNDLEKYWLAGKDVARKLSEHNIGPTAYGTRWYLTLFNLSIPFPAQLRVWDVFMLLGESPTPESSETSSDTTKVSEGPLHGFDILHAASAALIDAMREVLLDSDFENAMKTLTSWVPIKDEELLMKVTRAEWKQHQGKKKV